MTELPLDPHQREYVRRQLASGRFQTESDVIRAALQLMEQTVPTNASEPETAHASSAQEQKVQRADGRRSPRGLLSDIRSYISPDDIKEARKEMWAGLLHGEP